MSNRNASARAAKKAPRVASKASTPTGARTRARPTLRKPATIDEYLGGLSAEKRTVLEKLRRTLRKIVPNAEECISYAMPAFRLRGTVVAGFAATTKGCSYFPFSGSTLGTLADELRGYDKTKSALHFTPDQPLPAALVRSLLKARIAEIED